jgi:LSD1 subclass zinc finger protein
MEPRPNPPEVCPSCGHVHSPGPEGSGLGTGICPLTGRPVAPGAAGSIGSLDPAHANERAALFRNTHDEWLALTASYVLDDRDREHYAAAWRRLATLPGPTGPASWIPTEADLLGAVLAEVARRRDRGVSVGPPPGAAYGAGAPLLSCFREAPDGNAIFVRARRCHRCGAPKCTRSTTSFIYCDYCAAYFDYDLGIASRTAGAVDPRWGWMSFMTGYGDEMRRARDANDRRRYARLWREFYTYYTLMCYPACSPRIRDPEYRRTLIDGYLVTIAQAKNFDAQYRRAAREAGEAEDAIGRGQSGRVVPGSLNRLLDAFDRLLEVEAGISERCGAFAAHPDGLDHGLFLRVNHEEFAARWLRELDDEPARELAQKLGIAGDFLVPVPKGAQRHCGVCGAAVPILSGARQVLCETCGRILDASRIDILCPGCGAPLSVAAGARAARCAFCRVEFEPI